MGECPQYETNPIIGLNGNIASEEQSSVEAQLRAIANLIPAHVKRDSGTDPSGLTRRGQKTALFDPTRPRDGGPRPQLSCHARLASRRRPSWTSILSKVW